MTTRQQYFAGLRAGLPIVFGFITAAIAYAVLAAQAGMTDLQTILMSALVFAGSAQMLAAGMISQGAGVFAIVLATMIINLRHVIMSTCVMNDLKDSSTAVRTGAAFGITDEAFAVFTTAPREKRTMPFLLGIITVIYSAWVGGTVLGCITTKLLPEIVLNSMGITIYAIFIGLLMPNLRGNRRLLGIVLISAAISFVCSLFLPTAWTIVCTTLLGALIGTLLPEKEEAS